MTAPVSAHTPPSQRSHRWHGKRHVSLGRTVEVEGGAVKLAPVRRVVRRWCAAAAGRRHTGPACCSMEGTAYAAGTG
eukprot:gene721-43458_t